MAERAHKRHKSHDASVTPQQQNLESEEEAFLGAIDQGTTSTRFLIFDRAGRPVAAHQVELAQHHPHSGWHEHDPEELVDSVKTCITHATASFVNDGHSLSSVRAVGITNQRETTIVWDRESGQPLYRAIAWPDTRTQALVRELKTRPIADQLQRLCGLPLSTYPSAIKLVWLLRNVPAVREAYDNKRLAFGTVDTWLLWKLNGDKNAAKEVFVTDATNAARTMMTSLEKLEYDDELLRFFELDRSKIHLPAIVASSDATAFGAFADGPLKNVRIAGCLGDQSAALVGQCAFEPGMAKNTYGTGCFLLYNVGETPVISKHGLLATVAYHLGSQRKPVYALEGSIAVAGSGITFLIKNLGMMASADQVSDVAASVEDSGGCVFVTAFSGLFAPYWMDDAKGTVFGITQHTAKGHLARATLEAACFQTKAILDAMEKDSGHKLMELAVDGGMSNSDLCMQIQADVIGIPVDRPAMRETTALGAAIAAGIAIGTWSDLADVKNFSREHREVFLPRKTAKESATMYRRWSKAVEMCRGWVDESDELATEAKASP